jgi:hypothetical protein
MYPRIQSLRIPNPVFLSVSIGNIGALGDELMGIFSKKLI